MAATPAEPTGTEAPAPPPAAPEAAGPSLPVRVAVVAAFLAVAALGVLRVQDRVRGLEDFQVDLGTAWLDRAPAWLPEPERKALAADAAAAGRLSLHDEGLPDLLARRVESDPRVARVLGSRRRHPDAVEVLVELRRPVALVEAGGRLLAVDRDGVLVPGEFRKHPLPRIRGGGSDTPAPGHPFAPAVVEGASVAAALPPDLFAPLGLTVVDVGGVAQGAGVVLQRPGSRGSAALAVEWGRGPSSPEAALDPAPEAKIERLRLAARRFPGLQGLKAVRLGFDELVVVPL
jgi:hypothetical protein